jgi:AcrR family transcriptional regulator
MNLSAIRLPKTKTGYKSFNKIIEVSRQLFVQKGYSATSINEIIAESGVATGTFYIYFDDKRAVYDYLLSDYSHKIRKTINDAISNLETREEKEKVGLKTFIQFAVKDRLSYRIIWESLFVDPALFKDYYMKFAQAYIHQLEGSVKTGEVDENIDLETLSYVLMGIANFVGLQVIFHDIQDEETIDKITDQVMYILKHGMFKK